jgi:hypothetical protein
MARKLQNWLIGYRDYTAGTESPSVFHLWVGLSTLAGAAQRKIYLDHDFFQTHTNMFIVLVSPPGRSRKTTAMRMGKNLLKGVKDYGQDVFFSTQASSVAALVQQFVKISTKDHQSLTTFSYELGSLLGVKNDDVTNFLTDIYDCNPDWDKQTVGRGLELIERPWLNLLGATTPTWLGDNLSSTALEGGFMRRILFVYEDTRLLIALPKMTKAQKAIRQDLIEDLAHITALKGTFSFADKATESFYESWYENPKRLELETNPMLSGFYEVKAEHIKKVAMMLSLSEGDSLVITQGHLEAAIGMVEELEPGMKKALMSIGKNPFSTDLDRISDQIHTAGSLTYRQLLAMNIHSLEKAHFDDNLMTLVEIGRAYRENGVYYSPQAWEREGRQS